MNAATLAADNREHDAVADHDALAQAARQD
jgi:hypothetical protein